MGLLGKWLPVFTLIFLLVGINVGGSSSLEASDAGHCLSLIESDDQLHSVFEIDLENATPYAQACCRICRKGKACGDSCIARHLRCHQPPGCACNG